MKTRFPDQQDFAGTTSCNLVEIVADDAPRRHWRPRLSDWIILPPCHATTEDCARRHVTMHPDFLDVRTVLKEWAFPSSFFRVTYGIGPGSEKHSVALGYAIDLDRVPAVGRFLPLPGRVGADVFYWRQPIRAPYVDVDACVGKLEGAGDTAHCKRREGIGGGIRYEQFLSNLFGIFTAVRVYTPSLSEGVWVTFGPFLEAPLGKHSNVNIEGGLSFRPRNPERPTGAGTSGSPRFELRASVGLWKPKTSRVGLQAGSDDGKD
jgi:hypothetical protein